MQTVLITGASAGIGRELALRLARSHRLVLVARRRERLEEIAARCLEARVLACDLSQPGAVAQLHEHLAEPIDILVNNAGFGAVGSFAELSWERQEEMLRLNILSLSELTHRLLPGLRERRGQIVMVGSIAGALPGPFQAVYYASKAYVNSLALALSEELRGQVRVHTVCPGPTATEFQSVAGIPQGGSRARLPMQTGAEVAQAIEKLLEGDSTLLIPGWKNFLSFQLARLLPATLQARLSGVLGRSREAAIRSRGGSAPHAGS